MLSGKAAAAARPTALGSLLQASTYGMTIPVVYGVTQSPLLAIWAANLRQGGSVKKFKQLKKGITAYVENIDFLLGHNPIRGVLQMWTNGSLYPLNYVTQTITASAGRGTYAVSDSEFYAIVGVSLQATYSAVFNDYGGTGSQSPSGTYQIPLWNELETGPDPTDPMSYRCWPYCYRWQPGYPGGNTFYIDAEAFPGGTLTVYYARLMAATSFHPPIAKLRLVFEAKLGSGTEYADANLTSQQIIYTMFAGLGSSNIDLGSAGVIPQMQAEVQGKWSLYSAGDGDFADMIEDVVKSGLAQAAFGDPTIPNSQVEHGLSGYDLPGTIQKKADQSPTIGLPPMLYDLPNVPGNWLVCQVSSPGTLSISSTNEGTSWTPTVTAGSGYQVWYTEAVGGLNTVTVSGGAGPWNMIIYEIGGVGGVDTASSNSSGLPTMSCIMYSGVRPGLGAGNSAIAQLGGFAAPTLPSDAVITAIIPVISGSGNGGDLAAGYGTTTLPAIPGNGFGHPSPGFPGAAGQFYGLTIGTSLSALTGQWIGIEVANSVAGPAGAIGATGAFAVYYTSATPSVQNEPPLTPPVPLTAGQGLAWSLPTQGYAYAPALYYPVIPPDHSPEQWFPNGLATVTFPVGGTITVGPGVDTTNHVPSIPSYPPSATITGSGGGGGGGGNSVTSSTGRGFDGFIMSLPWYQLGAPSAMEVPIYKLLTPPNLFAGTTPNIQSHGRIVHNPGTYSIVEPGQPTIQVMLSFFSSEPASYPRPVYDFMDFQSLNCVRLQCRANGLWGSLSMNSQQAASDWLKMLYDAADAAPVFMGFKLFSVPWSEVSQAGNGAIYNAPTACGPLAQLTTENGDFLSQKNAAPITVKTAARVNQPNVLQMQIINRNSNYNPSVVEQPDAAGISFFGVRKADPIVNNAVQDVSIARQLLGIQVRKLQYGGDIYSFTLPAKWVLLSPMDLVTITDPLADINQIPVRITSITEQNDGSLDCDAEPFVYGMYAPNPAGTDNPTPYQPNPNSDVAPVNAPVIFEPVPGLIGSPNQGQIWLVISDSDPNYGGCQVYISTDGGSSYVSAGSPVVGNGVTGFTVGDWPAAASPDTTNNLSLDLSESLGTLDSYSTATQDGFVYPCYVAGGGSSIPYELMTYAVATLTASYMYTLSATGGNHLDRGVFGAPVLNQGVDHPTASRFAFLDPGGVGILKLPLQPAWIGETIFFKIIPFNNFAVPSGDLSTAVAYPYTVLGSSGAGPQLFLVNGV